MSRRQLVVNDSHCEDRPVKIYLPQLASRHCLPTAHDPVHVHELERLLLLNRVSGYLDLSVMRLPLTAAQHRRLQRGPRVQLQLASTVLTAARPVHCGPNISSPVGSTFAAESQPVIALRPHRLQHQRHDQRCRLGPVRLALVLALARGPGSTAWLLQQQNRQPS